MDYKDNPVTLIEDEETGDRFLVYGSQDGVRIDIQYKGETLWMSQAQIASLFGRDRTVISKHIQKIFDEGELQQDTYVQKMHISTGRPVTLYDLDMIISVGYRVSSKQATLFRKWATQTLVQFATKGFVVDSKRLKDPESADRVRELREIVKDIRADEANVYRELQRICALCQDYEGGSAQAIDFFKKMQAKLIYAVTSMTPSELIFERADSSEDNMGLKSWKNDNIRKSDVTISKNYLAQPEIKELNSLTVVLLDIFELQLDAGRLTLMREASSLLDQQLKMLDRGLLLNAGRMTKKRADNAAKVHYQKFDEARKQERHRLADKNIAEISKITKKLGKKR